MFQSSNLTYVKMCCLMFVSLLLPNKLPHLTFTFRYPLTAGVAGAPQMTSQPVSTIFPLGQ